LTRRCLLSNTGLFGPFGKKKKKKTRKKSLGKRGLTRPKQQEGEVWAGPAKKGAAPKAQAELKIGPVFMRGGPKSLGPQGGRVGPPAGPFGVAGPRAWRPKKNHPNRGRVLAHPVPPNASLRAWKGERLGEKKKNWDAIKGPPSSKGVKTRNPAQAPPPPPPG